MTPHLDVTWDALTSPTGTETETQDVVAAPVHIVVVAPVRIDAEVPAPIAVDHTPALALEGAIESGFWYSVPRWSFYL